MEPLPKRHAMRYTLRRKPISRYAINKSYRNTHFESISNIDQKFKIEVDCQMDEETGGGLESRQDIISFQVFLKQTELQVKTGIRHHCSRSPECNTQRDLSYSSVSTKIPIFEECRLWKLIRWKRSEQQLEWVIYTKEFIDALNEAWGMVAHWLS